MDRTPLTPEQTWDALGRLPDWRSRLGAFHAAYELPTVRAALDLVAAVGNAAEDLDHHPDVDWRSRRVFVCTTTHSAGWRVSAYDVELAARVSALAAAAGATPVPEADRTMEIAVDVEDPDRVRGWWAEVLGYRVAPDGSLYDPARRLPPVWFQESATPSANRLHLDISVAAETAADVVARARAAGSAVDEAEAPAFTVLTDADGNRVCICTPLGRAHPA